jgi:hypothetical protein
VRRPSIACWWIGLREQTKDAKTGGIYLGTNLLSTEGPGVGDSLAAEDWAGYLCPVEGPQKVLDGPLYGIKAKRNFLVEQFMLSVQVEDYRYSESEIELKTMNLIVQFKNMK